MSSSERSQIAEEEMRAGHNCCQSVLLAARRIWDITVDDNMIAAAAYFREGMGSGCTCGALVGMIMAAGILNRYYPHPDAAKISQHLHDQFKNEFGSTCCRVIKKRRPVLQRIGKKACIELTGKTVGMLCAAWEGVIYAPTEEQAFGINNNTHLE